MEGNFKLNKKIDNIIFIVIGILISVFLALVFFKSFKFGVILFLFFFFFFSLFKSGKLSFNNIVFLLLFCSILCPSIHFESIPDIRPELILILGAWLLFIFGKFAKGEDIKLKWTPTHKWFFIFGGIILVSILWAWATKGIVPIGRDFFEIAKLLEYFLIFALVANLDIKKEKFKKYYFFLLGCFFVSAIFGLIQYFDLFHNFNESFIEYLNPAHLDDWLKHKRIMGTTGNPNEFGVLMAIASVFSFTGILWSKKLETKIVLFIPLFVFIFSVILTISRSALICLISGFVFILLWKYPRKFKSKGKLKIAFIIIPILLILVIVFLLIAPSKFFVRIESLMSGEDRSLQSRLEKWGEAIDIWKSSPIFGWGPGKDKMTTIVDNEWLLLLRRYGIVGVLVFFLWFLNFYKGIGKIQHKNNNNLFLEIISVSLQASLIMIGVYMIPSAFYHSLQAMPILMTLLGLVYSQNSKQLNT